MVKPAVGKKCIPGVFCIENMTLFLIILIGIVVVYLYWQISKMQHHQQVNIPPPTQKEVILIPTPLNPRIDDVFEPPYKTLDIRGNPGILPIRGGQVPIQISTNNAPTAYQQVGILTKNGHSDPIILPLMGRNLLNGRDKWQYYTMSNTPGASINTRLPISVNGKSCTGEYGCDSVSNGDTVFVEGYNDTFRATIYENATLQYLPY